MNDQAPPAPPRRYWPLGQLILARLREFYREPEAIFWVYGFPILIVVALGIAFRSKPVERTAVDVQQVEGDSTSAKGVESVLEALLHKPFDVQVHDAPTCHLRLRTGKTEVVVVPPSASRSSYQYEYDPTRPESLLARGKVDDVLQRAKGREDVLKFEEATETGTRYIDFLIPGLLGMSLMGGGL